MPVITEDPGEVLGMLGQRQYLSSMSRTICANELTSVFLFTLAP